MKRYVSLNDGRILVLGISFVNESFLRILSNKYDYSDAGIIHLRRFKQGQALFFNF